VWPASLQKVGRSSCVLQYLCRKFNTIISEEDSVRMHWGWSEVLHGMNVIKKIRGTRNAKMTLERDVFGNGAEGISNG